MLMFRARSVKICAHRQPKTRLESVAEKGVDQIPRMSHYPWTKAGAGQSVKQTQLI